MDALLLHLAQRQNESQVDAIRPQSRLTQRPTQREGRAMTVNDTHVILLQQAMAEVKAMEVALPKLMKALAGSSHKRSAEARQTSLQCSMVMRSMIAARVAVETLERTASLMSGDET